MSGFAIPENVVEAAAKAMWGAPGVMRCYPWDPGMPDCMVAMDQVRLGLGAALAEWGATVDDDDGHNSHYRVITDWTPKREGQARA